MKFCTRDTPLWRSEKNTRVENSPSHISEMGYLFFNPNK